MGGDFLTPVDLDDREDKPVRRRGPPRGPLFAALAVLLLSLGVILWFGRRLPDAPPPRPTPVPVRPTPTPDPAMRLEAEVLSGQLITALQPLRSAAPEIWAASEWEALMQRQREANQALANRQYGTAADAYRDALSLAEDLAEQLSEAPQRLYETARFAVEAGRRGDALEALDALRFLDSRHAAGIALRPRAEVADQTHAARERALDAMEREDWPMAFLAVNRAMELDPEFPDVRSMHTAVREQLAGEVLDRPAMRERERSELLATAQRREAAEDWEAAHRAWLQLGQIWEDSSVAEGVERTRTFRVLEERINRAAGALRSSQADALAEDLQDWEGPELAEGLAVKAGTFLEAWRLENMPVPVRFTSDAETEVTLLRVGRWGTFVERTEELLPGDYVAVGSRLGHRDVRVPFTVPPGSESVEVDVRTVEGF
jgi:hypothetical protein